MKHKLKPIDIPESCYSMDCTEALNIPCNVDPNLESKPISAEADGHQEGKHENHEETVCC